MIKIEGLSKIYTNEILKDVSVEINKGDVISIIGPSGCGKSTFLRCINMLATPTSGKILIDGQDITSADKKELARLRQKMGMVFQYYNLFAHMTIIENVMLGPVNLLGVDKQTAYDEGMALLESMGLSNRALHYPDALSGGQKQRAAIARTLAMKPEVILLDEPTAALDPRMIGEVLAVIKRLADSGMTMLIVTHEMNFAKNVSNRIFYMDDKGIYEDGSPEQIFDNPIRPKTRDFIFHVKTFSYEIRPTSFDYYELLGQVAAFMRKQLFDDTRIQHVLLVLEEAIHHSVLEAGTDMRTLLNIRYTEKTGELEINFTDVSGATHYPYEDMDEISRRVIDGYAKSVESVPGALRISM